jgi:hypothetical protein
MMAYGFDLSEKLGEPIVLRVVTRLAHSRAAVEVTEPMAEKLLSPSTDQWVLLPGIARKKYVKLIEKQERAYQGAYGQFALDMQRLLSENGLQNRISIYPTTYGIGVWVFYNWSAKKDIERVTAIMEAKGIDYENEYSEAGWVYRYKVSKRADNLAKVAA